MRDNPEPFTQSELFLLVDFARAIVLVCCSAAVVLLGIPFLIALF